MSYLDERLGLAGKRAVVIGAGGGLGRACAVDLARAGVDLALVDRDESLLDECAVLVRACGVACVIGAFDARDADEMTAFFGRVDQELAPAIDILINVVGGTFRQSFVDSTPKGWDVLMRTNFTWLLHATQLAIPRIRATGRGGSIVNVTSIEGHRGAPGFAVYAGIKAAVVNFSRALGVELAPERIRVNTVAPDMIPTPGIMEPDDPAASLSDDSASLMGTTIAIPMGRRGEPSDLSGCVLFLASDLSTYVTGTSLHPDGGALAGSGWHNWPVGGFRNVPPPIVTTPLVEG
jgi:NAD(P)-dependent dehydrogenase (short-subunit alcohol dehydrogenase family)